MLRQTIALVSFSILATLGVITPAHAEITATIGDFGSLDGYDFVTSLPPSTYQNIGTFTFTLPAGAGASGITVSGSFGSIFYGTTTALSDYYLGFAGDEEAVEVAACDDPAADCYSAQAEGPTAWTATLTQTQIGLLLPAIDAGAIDFGYTWDTTTPPVPDALSQTGYDPQYVNAGPATLVISPEPSTVLLCFSGLTGLAALRRFRKL